jgi:hypothetical protein
LLGQRDIDRLLLGDLALHRLGLFLDLFLDLAIQLIFGNGAGHVEANPMRARADEDLT